MDIKNIDLFFSENPNPMWIYDPSNLSIKNVNDAALDLYGYSRQEFLSLNITDLRPRSEVDKLKSHLSELKGEHFKNAGIWKHQRQNGDLLFVQIMATVVKYEGATLKLVVAQDVTRKVEFRNKFESLFKNSLDGVMLTKPTGEILEVNQAACDMLGMSEEEIIQQGRDGLVVKDEKLQTALKRREETGQFSGELTFFHKDGHTIPVDLTTSVFDYYGETRTSIIIRDLSHRKKAEQALENERRFSEIALNSMPGIFFVLNSNGEVIKWNNNSNEVFGLTDQQINGRPAVDFVHEEDKQRILDEIVKVFSEGRTTIEIKLNTANETTAIYQFVANRFEQDSGAFIVGSGVDITKKIELEQRLNESLKKEHSQRKQAESERDKLRDMFEKAPSPKCVLTGPNHIFYIANDSYKEVVGQQNIIGKSIKEVIPEIESQGYIDILDHVYQTGEPFIGEQKPLTIEKKYRDEKSEYVFNILFEPLFNEQGEVYGIFAEGIDLSDQLEYQHKLERSIDEKETLLSEIHHRVKNNLAVVTSMLELQAMRSDDDTLQTALRSGQQRILTIASIHELLYSSESFSSINFQTNIHNLIENLQNIYDTEQRISIHLQADEVVLNINQAIPCALIINEVITNAYKHAFKPGERGMIDISLSEQDGFVQIKIADNGVGFKKTMDFASTSSLGMTLIGLLKKQLNAEVEYSNGTGTHFSLKFEKQDMKGSSSAIVD